MTDDFIDVCLLWEEVETVPERRSPESRAERREIELLAREIVRRHEMRMAVIAAGLEVE